MQKLTKAKLEHILTSGLALQQPEFHLESAGGRISGAVVSSSFKGKRDSQRQMMIWHELDRALGAESVKLVGMLLAYTPEEWNIGQSSVAASGRQG